MIPGTKCTLSVGIKLARYSVLARGLPCVVVYQDGTATVRIVVGGKFYDEIPIAYLEAG